MAFDGGVDVPPVLGVGPAHGGAALGGLDGPGAVGRGSIAAWASDAESPAERIIAARTPTVAPPSCLSGPQDEFFPESAIRAPERTRFTVTPQSNRMGYRLSGAALPRVADREMIWTPSLSVGIQVPASGEPILLMSDRQTTGRSIHR